MTHQLIDELAEKVLTVPEYLNLINDLIAPLTVAIEGEVTDLKILPQWVFFSLKDAETGALLNAGLHAGVYKKLGVNLEEGMHVKIGGYGKIQQKSGRFGFWVSSIAPVGEGALRRAYELLLTKLKEEGLFARKRDLPNFISHIGVVSSRNGVVLQDLQRNLRQCGIQIDFMHAGVEGAGSAGELLSAIEHLSNSTHPPDVLVLIRGGGSMESLQGFNNEAVCRALFRAPMPVLVGIGHDVDAPIATMVADWSASTPTAVAHTINQSWDELVYGLPQLEQTLLHATRRRIASLQHQAAVLTQGITAAMHRFLARITTLEQSVRTWALLVRQRTETVHHCVVSEEERFVARLRSAVEGVRSRISAYERVLLIGDPERQLARGYAMLSTTGGRIVKKTGDVQKGDVLNVRMQDGTIDTTVTGIHSHK